jgi:hypothetical protein
MLKGLTHNSKAHWVERRSHCEHYLSAGGYFRCKDCKDPSARFLNRTYISGGVKIVAT